MIQPFLRVAALLLVVSCSYSYAFGQSGDVINPNASAERSGQPGASSGQSSTVDKIVGFPSKFFTRIQAKTTGLDQQLTQQTEKYIRKMASREARLKRKLEKNGDSAAVKTLFSGDPAQRYAALLRRLQGDTSATLRAVSGAYSPYADSLHGAISFVSRNPQLLDASKLSPTDIQNSLNQYAQLQNKLQDAGEIQQFMQQRKAQISQYLNQYTHLPGGITDEYNAYNKQLYYYGEQVKAYKDMLGDPDKMMTSALQLLDKLPSFSSFMRSNSMLSGLLGMGGNPIAGAPGAPGGSGAGTTVQGLATRDQVMNAFQEQAGAGPNATALAQQNIGSAQGQIDQLRDKMSGSGSNGGNIDMPDFKPNSQKTKSFLKRLEFGTNLQTTHGNYYFPTTTDLGISLGYKIDDHNSIGIGASYKMGWGTDINHVKVSSQGMGLRSYLDMQMKKSWYASGGFEYNYQQPVTSAQVLNDLSSWQQSGLIGVSKIVSMKTRAFKNTKMQLLWDFLSYQQIPRAQPFKFRVGYTF